MRKGRRTRKTNYPRYVISYPLSGGLIGFTFNPPSWARKADCPIKTEKLGTNYDAMKDRVESVLLPQFYDWLRARNGVVLTDDDGIKIMSVDWLFKEYRKTWSRATLRRLKPLGRGQQRNHNSSINLISNHILKDNTRFGLTDLRSIDGGVVEKLFNALLYKDDGTQRRTSVIAAMKMFGAAWNEVGRNFKDVPAKNPLAKVGFKTNSKPTPTATYQELQTFVAKADELGYSSMGTAAMMAFEWLQRESAIFATFDVSHFRHKQHQDCALVLHPKTGEEVWYPLNDPDTGEELYPELAARLDKLKKDRIGLMLVRDWGDRGPWPTYPESMGGEPDFSQVARTTKEIMQAAGMREELTFRSFRHGGFTEAGDSDMTDRQITAQGGHTGPKVLPKYVKRTLRQVATGTKKRRAGRCSPTATAITAVDFRANKTGSD